LLAQRLSNIEVLQSTCLFAWHPKPTDTEVRKDVLAVATDCKSHQREPRILSHYSL